MVPAKKVEELILRHKSLETELSSGNIDSLKLARLSKELSEIKPISDQADVVKKLEEVKSAVKAGEVAT